MRKFEAKYEEPDDKDRWVISYADFITLLFAFFVVMYSISSVNESKYQIVAAAFDKLFNKPITSVDPINLGNISSFVEGKDFTEANMPVSREEQEDLQHEYDYQLPLKLLSDNIENKFKGLIENNKLQVVENPNWLEIQISSEILFKTGGIILTEEAQEILKNLSVVFNQVLNPIAVEGYTDNQIINNGLYPSNWELSADRAAVVVRELIANGVLPARLSVVGYGQNFPMASNKTETGRAKNRRVVMLIEKNSNRKTYLDDISQYDDLNNSLLKAENPDMSFDLQKERVIEPKPVEGNALKPIIAPDGTVKFNASSVYDKNKEEE